MSNNEIVGPTGPRGYKGRRGEDGIEGFQGSKGSKGCPGPKGFPGDIGPTGDIGITGDVGMTGVFGKDGHTGDSGPTGSVTAEILVGILGDPTSSNFGGFLQTIYIDSTNSRNIDNASWDGYYFTVPSDGKYTVRLSINVGFNIAVGVTISDPVLDIKINPVGPDPSFQAGNSLIFEGDATSLAPNSGHASVFFSGTLNTGDKVSFKIDSGSRDGWLSSKINLSWSALEIVKIE